MVGYAVLLAGFGGGGAVGIQQVVSKLRCPPYFGCICGQAISADFDGRLIPLADFAKPKVQFERAVGKANGVAVLVGDLVALIGEGVIAVFAVVARQR